MHIPLKEAEGRLAHLVRRAGEGDEVVITLEGEAAVRLVPVAWQPAGVGEERESSQVRSVPVGEARRTILEAALGSGAVIATAGPSAARSQDFLYDENGLPR